jgi:RNA polymerase sigma-70 factor (ECF subfamily)
VTPDTELVNRVRRGDIEAFGELVDRHQRSVLAVGLGELRDVHAAEDIAQAAFLLAFRRLPTLRNGAKFGPWLMQIARRQVIETARARKVALGIPADECCEASTSGAQPWVEHEHLLTLIARLPQHERVLVGLRYFDDQSMAQIADISGRPLGTVTKQLSRAVARLRTWYEEDSR